MQPTFDSGLFSNQTEFPNLFAKLHSLFDSTIPPLAQRSDILSSVKSYSKSELDDIVIDFELEYPTEMQALRVGMVHPHYKGEVKNFLTGEVLKEDFTNIGYHCVAVGYAAKQICAALEESGVLDHELSKQIVSRALVHDATKVFEIMRSKVISTVEGQLADLTESKPLAKFLTQILGKTAGQSAEELVGAVKSEATLQLEIAATVVDNRAAAGKSLDDLISTLSRAGVPNVLTTALQGESKRMFDKSLNDLSLDDVSALKEKISQKMTDGLDSMAKSPLTFYVPNAYTTAGYQEVEKRLIVGGFVTSPELANYLAKARDDTGHNSLGKISLFYLGGDELTAEQLATIVVHLADDMTSTDLAGDTCYLTPLRRMDASGFRGNVEGIRGYPWMMSEGVEIYRESTTSRLAYRDTKDFTTQSADALDSTNYFALQDKIGNACAATIVNLMQPELGMAPEEAARYLEKFLGSRDEGN